MTPLLVQNFKTLNLWVFSSYMLLLLLNFIQHETFNSHKLIWRKFSLCCFSFSSLRLQCCYLKPFFWIYHQFSDILSG